VTRGEIICKSRNYLHICDSLNCRDLEIITGELREKDIEWTKARLSESQKAARNVKGGPQSKEKLEVRYRFEGRGSRVEGWGSRVEGRVLRGPVEGEARVAS
jgi:hypothetical protein